MHKTHIYGCPIHSDFPLLETRHDTEPLDASMRPLLLKRVTPDQHLGDFPVSFKSPLSHGREISIRSDRDTPHLEEEQPWCLEIGGLLSFYGRGGDPQIYYQGNEQATNKLVSFWFVHVIAPYALTVERSYCFLHASAVSFDRESVAFLAESNGGKSTLASYFLTKDHSLVSDDKVAVVKQADRYLTVPSHPYFRPYRSNEELGHHSDNFSTGSKPLKAIYILEKNDGETIDFERLSGALALSSVMASCLNLFPVFWTDRLSFLGDLARCVPIFRTKRPWGLDHMEDVYLALRQAAEV